LRKPKNKFSSDAGRRLVSVKLAKMSASQIKAHGKLMSDAYWQSPVGLAKRRAILEKKITDLQVKLAEIQKLEKKFLI
jgi:hypothetical protein